MQTSSEPSANWERRWSRTQHGRQLPGGQGREPGQGGAHQGALPREECRASQPERRRLAGLSVLVGLQVLPGRPAGEAQGLRAV